MLRSEKVVTGRRDRFSLNVVRLLLTCVAPDLNGGPSYKWKYCFDQKQVSRQIRGTLCLSVNAQCFDLDRSILIPQFFFFFYRDV